VERDVEIRDDAGDDSLPVQALDNCSGLTPDKPDTAREASPSMPASSAKRTKLVPIRLKPSRYHARLQLAGRECRKGAANQKGKPSVSIRSR
jgi:hypothetical protein